MDALPTQVYETVYGVDPQTRREWLAAMPKDAAGRRAFAEKTHGARNAGVADVYRRQLAQRYGAKAARAIRYAETFEICEYGHQPGEDEIRRLFPFFPRARRPRNRKGTAGP